MPHPDEGLIHEWLDGELDAATTARVEALVANDTQWAAAAAEARGLIAASSRIVRALDHVPGGVVPKRTNGPSRRVPQWWMMRAAAVLVVVVGTVAVLRQRDAATMVQETPPQAPPPNAVAPAKISGTITDKGLPKVEVAARVRPGPSNIASVPAAKDAGAGVLARQSLRDGPEQSLDSAPSSGRRRADAPAAVFAVPAVVAAPEAKKEARTTSGLLLAREPSVSCFVVQLPPALAGRTVVYPADSLGQALWAEAGVNSNVLIARNDSLLSPTRDSAPAAAVRAIAVRAKCPDR